MRGAPAVDGDPCIGNADCQSGVCAAQGEMSFCTSTCDAADPCTTGLECTAVGGVSVCAPVLAIVGQRCEANEACASGLCASGICTRICGRGVGDCPSGTTCLPAAPDGTRACTPNRPLPPPSRADGGGCTAAAGGVQPPRSSGAWLALAALGLFLLVARRSRDR
ncbi:MAG: hypothetical protein IT379_20570 [Deltaproteobacteria bacterium]|nr:hypothetical protein [Deltaproteobacteria bacterium]